MAISTILCPSPDLDLPKFTFKEFVQLVKSLEDSEQLAKTNAVLEKQFAKMDTGKRSRNAITRLALIA